MQAASPGSQPPPPPPPLPAPQIGPSDVLDVTAVRAAGALRVRLTALHLHGDTRVPVQVALHIAPAEGPRYVPRGCGASSTSVSPPLPRAGDSRIELLVGADCAVSGPTRCALWVEAWALGQGAALGVGRVELLGIVGAAGDAPLPMTVTLAGAVDGASDGSGDVGEVSLVLSYARVAAPTIARGTLHVVVVEGSGLRGASDPFISLYVETEHGGPRKPRGRWSEGMRSVPRACAACTGVHVGGGAAPAWGAERGGVAEMRLDGCVACAEGDSALRRILYLEVRCAEAAE